MGLSLRATHARALQRRRRARSGTRERNRFDHSLVEKLESLIVIRKNLERMRATSAEEQDRGAHGEEGQTRGENTRASARRRGGRVVARCSPTHGHLEALKDLMDLATSEDGIESAADPLRRASMSSGCRTGAR